MRSKQPPTDVYLLNGDDIKQIGMRNAQIGLLGV